MMTYYKASLPSRSRLFWLCQCGGWFVYAVLTEIMIKLSGDEPWQIHVPHLLLDTFCGLAITLGLRELYLKSATAKKYMVFSHIFLLVGAALLWTQFKWYSLQALYGSWWEPMSWFDFGTWTTASLTMLAAWSAVYYGIKNYLNLVDERDRADEALHLAKEAQLQMLRYQLNPHFMFNSINAICTLILKNDSLHAITMLEKLCDFLRYSLHTEMQSMIPVKEEIAILQNYLDIEKSRFQSQLQVLIETDSASHRAQIPALLIQPLVENILKHGMIANKPIHIHVSVSACQGKLTIMVKDNGKGFSELSDDAPGIGMANCKARLNIIYQGEASMENGNNETGGAWVCITIPQHCTA